MNSTLSQSLQQKRQNPHASETMYTAQSANNTKNASADTTDRNNNNNDQQDEQDSSGDEFLEITEEEIETWSSVERKRFNFKTCASRDEHLLRQALDVKPFNGATKKERFDRWQEVAVACDEIIKSLPENASGQLNFFLGKHAKRRFKVLMEAHYGLINNNKNPMFFGIYGEYGNIQALIERAYELYLLAGYKSGQSTGFSKKKRRLLSGSIQNAKRLRPEDDDDNPSEVASAIQQIQEYLNTHHASKVEDTKQEQLQMIREALSRMEKVHRKLLATLDRQGDSIRTLIKTHKSEVEEITQESQKKMRDMEHDMEQLLKKYDEAEKQKQKEWNTMCERWMTQQREMLTLQKDIIVMQSKTEGARMDLVRELIEEMKQP
ncbi:hypothetical protein BDB00DRAFT_826589 [Zychaea mexicana]|uniref:uncharacterized protein n=1 Tax=Zychaea mexicana TaxID=64656 RepID=UPI0022FE70F8|nr:uncharacterized protein BDB00DRAFT_826589 [Zychaea mexicana]KAI9492830.1 hypothetical protein BDB00DRAFT_826589 [Zychaea mexicana]